MQPRSLAGKFLQVGGGVLLGCAVLAFLLGGLIAEDFGYGRIEGEFFGIFVAGAGAVAGLLAKTRGEEMQSQD